MTRWMLGNQVVVVMYRVGYLTTDSLYEAMRFKREHEPFLKIEALVMVVNI